MLRTAMTVATLIVLLACSPIDPGNGGGAPQAVGQPAEPAVDPPPVEPKGAVEELPG